MKKQTKLVFILFLLASFLQASSVEEKVIDAANTFKNLTKKKNAIPKDVIKKAKLIVVIPDMSKVGFLYGSNSGTGIASYRRENGEWSLPFFMSLSGGNAGIQVGYESADIILFFMTEHAVKELLNEKFTVGAGASASAGPLGGSYEQNADSIDADAEILVYSDSGGLFFGATFNGYELAHNEKANIALHGNRITVDDVLSKSSKTDTYSINEFVTALQKASDEEINNQDTNASQPIVNQNYSQQKQINQQNQKILNEYPKPQGNNIEPFDTKGYNSATKPIKAVGEAQGTTKRVLKVAPATEEKMPNIEPFRGNDF